MSQNLLWRSGLGFGIKLTGALCNLGVQVLLARSLGSTAYGYYTLAFTWLNLLVLLSKGGWDVAALTFVTRYYTQQDQPRLLGFVRSSWIATIALSFAITGTVALLLMRLSIMPAPFAAAMWVTVITLIPWTILQLQQAQVRAWQRPIASQLPGELIIPLVMLLGLSLAALHSNGLLVGLPAWFVAGLPAWLTTPTTAAAAMAWQSGAIVLALLSFLPLTPPELRRIQQQAFRQHRSICEANWLQTALRMVCVTGLSLLLLQIDLLMLGLWATPAETGLYGAATRLARPLLFVLAAANTVFIPLIVQAHTQGNHNQLQALVSRSAVGVTIGTVFIAIGLLSLGRQCLAAFGSEFQAAYPSLVVLVLAQCFSACMGCVESLLTVTGFERDVSATFAAALVLDVICNALLIPHYGALGAAIATAITIGVWNTIAAILTWQRLGIVAIVVPRKS